jgi:hypothetical protein
MSFWNIEDLFQYPLLVLNGTTDDEFQVLISAIDGRWDEYYSSRRLPSEFDRMFLTDNEWPLITALRADHPTKAMMMIQGGHPVNINVRVPSLLGGMKLDLICLTESFDLFQLMVCYGAPCRLHWFYFPNGTLLFALTPEQLIFVIENCKYLPERIVRKYMLHLLQGEEPHNFRLIFVLSRYFTKIHLWHHELEKTRLSYLLRRARESAERFVFALLSMGVINVGLNGSEDPVYYRVVVRRQTFVEALLLSDPELLEGEGKRSKASNLNGRRRGGERRISSYFKPSRVMESYPSCSI